MKKNITTFFGGISLIGLLMLPSQSLAKTASGLFHKDVGSNAPPGIVDSTGNDIDSPVPTNNSEFIIDDPSDNTGFYFPDQMKWYLKNDQTDGWIDYLAFKFGGPSGSQPVAGDWD